jgi:DNA-binding transcriptional ArsR family regulator
MRSHGSASDRVRPLDRAPFFWQSQYVSIREDQSGSSGQLRAVWQALNDASRLRLLALLQEQELSVSELQAITYLSQSLISSHLGVLKKAGVIHHRRAGKSHFYQASPIHHSEIQTIIDAAMTTLGELPEAREDGKQLKATLRKRRQDAQAYFNKIAGKLGKAYCPGRTWSSVGPLLSHLVPEVDIADLGAGEGWLTLMLAQRARHVIAVDNSRKMVEFARKQLKERKIKTSNIGLVIWISRPLTPPRWISSFSARPYIMPKALRKRFGMPSPSFGREVASLFSISSNIVSSKRGIFIMTAGWVSAKLKFFPGWKKPA